MKFYTEQKHRENMNTADMLQGCANRMCVTDDKDELNKLLTSAILHLTKLHSINTERVLEKLYGDKDTQEKNMKTALDAMFK